MGEKITFLINTSELAAGTRGSSLGPDAIITAARTIDNGFFAPYKINRIEDENHLLDFPVIHPCAKRIQGFSLVCDRVIKNVGEILNTDHFPFILAGDHGSAAATIAGIKKKYPDKRLGVIWIDAHADLHSPYTTPSGNIHGMPLSIALGLDNLESKLNNIDNETDSIWQGLKNMGIPGPKLMPEDLVFISVRDIEPEEKYLIEKFKIRNFSVDEVNSLGPEATVQKVLEKLAHCDLLYVSFDVDSMDPKATSSGTGTPAKNGLMPKQAKELLRGFKKSSKTVCMEFVEVNPCLDEKLNRMAEVAFDILKAVVAVENNQ